MGIVCWLFEGPLCVGLFSRPLFTGPSWKSRSGRMSNWT
jgi:hypothetical protein